MIKHNYSQFLSLAQTGMVMDLPFDALPSGWVMCDGRSIGNSSSGATARANSDTQNLFVHLWNSLANAQAPVSGGRGASALSDYNANKVLILPDFRGTTAVGKDDLGGTPANRITVAGTGNNATVPGARIGANTIILNSNHLPNHTHTTLFNNTNLDHNHQMICSDSAGDMNSHGRTDGDGNAPGMYLFVQNVTATATDTTSSNDLPAHRHVAVFGNNTTTASPHNNMMSFMVTYKMIKL